MYVNAAIALMGALWMFAFPQQLRGSTAARISDARRAAMPRQRSQEKDTSPWTLAKINKEEKVEIYNMEGRKVLETTIGNGRNTINVSHLQVGDYLLRIKGLEVSTKFIKK